MAVELTSSGWLLLGLAAFFGLLIGAAFASGGGRRHKDRARVEAARADELQRENETLRKDLREMESLRGAAARAPATTPVVEPEVRRRGVI